MLVRPSRPTVVVGGGLVGLATAWALARRGRPVVVLEKEDDWGRHQSGRCIGVVHTGIFNRPGTDMQRHCAAAQHDLEAFCLEHEVPFERRGKVVVATDTDQVPHLDRLAERAKALDVKATMLGPQGLADVEPHVRAVQALHIPELALTDYQALTRTFVRLLTEKGADLRLGSRVIAVQPREDGAQVLTRSDRTYVVHGSRIVLCAGVHSDRLTPGGVRRSREELAIVPLWGEHAFLRKGREDLVRSVIYPVPDEDEPVIGLHFARALDGRVHVGSPNVVLAVGREASRLRDMTFADIRESLTFPGTWRMGRRHGWQAAGEVGRWLVPPLFIRSARKIIPDLQWSDLRPTPASLRAQAVRRDGRMCDDFLVVQRGAVTSVMNAPSPAASACLGLGDQIATSLL